MRDGVLYIVLLDLTTQTSITLEDALGDRPSQPLPVSRKIQHYQIGCVGSPDPCSYTADSNSRYSHQQTSIISERYRNWRSKQALITYFWSDSQTDLASDSQRQQTSSGGSRTRGHSCRIRCVSNFIQIHETTLCDKAGFAK